MIVGLGVIRRPFAEVFETSRKTVCLNSQPKNSKVPATTVWIHHGSQFNRKSLTAKKVTSSRNSVINKRITLMSAKLDKLIVDSTVEVLFQSRIARER